MPDADQIMARHFWSEFSMLSELEEWPSMQPKQVMAVFVIKPSFIAS
jgi:hypothetical protein